MLLSAIAARDFPLIERKAHDVKTNCLWVGASVAAEHALLLELMGKKTEEERFEELFPLMDTAVGEALRELDEYRKGL